MYTYMYLCTYMYVYIHVYIYMHTCTYIICTCIHVHVYTCTYVYMYMYIYTCICTCILAQLRPAIGWLRPALPRLQLLSFGRLLADWAELTYNPNWNYPSVTLTRFLGTDGFLSLHGSMGWFDAWNVFAYIFEDFKSFQMWIWYVQIARFPLNNLSLYIYIYIYIFIYVFCCLYAAG